jgi:alkylation response protein AidB-like acyl-CoA dehydrogenase
VSLAVPEGHGGGGGGILDLAVAAECFGGHLAPVPLIEAAVATLLLSDVCQRSDSDVTALASKAISGEMLATMALRPAVDGVASVVPAGAVADLVIALDGQHLVLQAQPTVSPATPAPVIANLGAAPIGHCSLRQGNPVILARGPEALDVHARAVRQWKALTAASLVGLGFQALEIGLDYVQQRRAFGVLIATFQTIQHRLADNVTALEGARLLAYEAAWAEQERQASASTLAAMAYLFAAESAFKTASESLHFHGGYGYTLEYDIQLYFRRAKAWSLLSGDPRHQLVNLAKELFQGRRG